MNTGAQTVCGSAPIGNQPILHHWRLWWPALGFFVAISRHKIAYLFQIRQPVIDRRWICTVSCVKHEWTRLLTWKMIALIWVWHKAHWLPTEQHRWLAKQTKENHKWSLKRQTWRKCHLQYCPCRSSFINKIRIAYFIGAIVKHASMIDRLGYFEQHESLVGDCCPIPECVAHRHFVPTWLWVLFMQSNWDCELMNWISFLLLIIPWKTRRLSYGQ